MATSHWTARSRKLRRLHAAPAAPGKTFVLNRVIDQLKEKYGATFGSKVAVCASTGIAATHISGKLLTRCHHFAAVPSCVPCPELVLCAWRLHTFGWGHA